MLLPQPMIFAGALYFGFLPRLVELLGWPALSASVAAMQSSLWGLLYYGLLVFCMEFVPVGGINPREVAEYLGLMNVGIKVGHSFTLPTYLSFSSTASLCARVWHPWPVDITPYHCTSGCGAR